MSDGTAAETKATESRPARLSGVRAALVHATVDNPVLVKEFRTRMRGTRAYWMLLGYTLLLAGVLAMMYFSSYASAVAEVQSGGGVNMHAARDIGRNMYYFVFIAQAIMVALITPAITAGTVTIEREQRSYELLVTTPLRPADIIRGKLAAAVSFVVLLLTASLPLVSLSFLVGGVSPSEIFFSYLIVALGAFLYGALGIFWSATLRSTAIATAVTYLTVLSLFVLTAFLGVTASFTTMVTGGGTSDFPFQSLNPVMAAHRAVQPEYFFWTQIPAWVSASVLNLLAALLITHLAMSRLEHFDPPRPIWTRLLSASLWCSFGLFLFGPSIGAQSKGWTAVKPLNEATSTLLITVLVLAALITPVFATGDLIVRRGESALGRYLRGFLPHRLLGNDLSCGTPLVVAWTLFFALLIPFGIWTTGRAMFFKPMAVFVPGTLVCLSVVLGLAGIGNFLSVALPSRWAACVLTYLIGIALLLLPQFTLLTFTDRVPRPKAPSLWWQPLYLVPFNGLLGIGYPASFMADHPPMLFDRVAPMWAVTSVLYLAVGALGFFLTAWRVNSQGKLLQRRMEAVERAHAPAAPEAAP
jgi:ABC-type transport system involved in multi-copper enzyme maturation permease subunit